VSLLSDEELCPHPGVERPFDKLLNRGRNCGCGLSQNGRKLLKMRSSFSGLDLELLVGRQELGRRLTLESS